MNVASIYAARALPRPSLSDDIVNIIAKLKISFQVPFRRLPPGAHRPPPRRENDNWRENNLADMVRKVKEKDDPDYSEIVSKINKLGKANYGVLMADFLERLKKRDDLFRFRVTTLLFDNGIKMNFFAPIMADAYAEIVKAYPDALQDLASQTSMFNKLYDTENITLIPSSSDPGYDAAIIAWTKQKETKRGFAVYVAELYTRGLVPEETMAGFVTQVMDDLRDSIRSPKTPANEEHVDALVRFIFAVTTKVPMKTALLGVLKTPKAETPSLNMKSRFRLEDAAKASK
jgi:hypothetical protein